MAEENTAPETAAPQEAAAEAAPKQSRARRGGNPRRPRPLREQEKSAFIDKSVNIARVSKTVKGGRRMGFSALVVSGDPEKHIVGIGLGKAKEVPEAIKKATAHAHREMVEVKMRGNTIPHEVFGVSDGGKVLLRPAAPGTGIIAGTAVRAVLEVIGVKDVLTKSLGSNNKTALVKATLAGLKKLRTLEQIRAARS